MKALDRSNGLVYRHSCPARTRCLRKRSLGRREICQVDGRLVGGRANRRRIGVPSHDTRVLFPGAIVEDIEFIWPRHSTSGNLNFNPHCSASLPGRRQNKLLDLPHKHSIRGQLHNRNNRPAKKTDQAQN